MHDMTSIMGRFSDLLDEMSNDPVVRAQERMRDAKARGGADEMIKATEKRIKATKDRDKLAGIAVAIQNEIDSGRKTYSPAQLTALEGLRSAAMALFRSTGGGALPAKPSGSVASLAGEEQGRKLVPGPGGEHYVPKYPHAILPAGRIDVVSGKNEYWDSGTVEVWSDQGKLFAVYTSYNEPGHAIGDIADFEHDQTQRMLRRGATMVGWFSVDPKGKYGGTVPTKGSLPVATYK